MPTAATATRGRKPKTTQENTTAAPETKRLVMVGYKTLSAPVIRLEDPIRYGEVVEVGGQALAYAEKAVYIDADNFECNVFVPEDSEEGKRAIAIASGEALPQRGPRRRPANRRARR